MTPNTQSQGGWRESLYRRFQNKFIPEPNSGCWLWTCSVNKRGYGKLFGVKKARVGKQSEMAHRVSYQIYKGEIPEGLLVCHTCDNPCCVNPEHLFVGTHKDNYDDMRRKNRHTLPPLHSGETHPTAKYGESLLDDIRRSPLSSRKAARVFGISDSYIRQIRRGLWRSTPPTSEA